MDYLIKEPKVFDNNNDVVIRIKEIELKNFKNVEYGIIKLQKDRFEDSVTCSDILGIYGQNGSGKSSLINALEVLQMIMSGNACLNDFERFIIANENTSTLRFKFDLSYSDGKQRSVDYEFQLSNKPIKEIDGREDYVPNQILLKILNEKLSMSGLFYGKKRKNELIIDTSEENILPSEIIQNDIYGERKNIFSLGLNKIRTNPNIDSRVSLIFNKQINQFFNSQSEFTQVINELVDFAQNRLIVIDSQQPNTLTYLQFFTKLGCFKLSTNDKTITEDKTYFCLKNDFASINYLLNTIIPGLQIKIKDLLNEECKNNHMIEIYSVRNNREIPLCFESEGIKKIVSFIGSFIMAYNLDSFTLAIDELDAGIFEYLLGELLQTFEESGRGQLIFTSHNLRPLEVISKKFLYFTTTNPKNRYIKLKGIGNSTNLRNTYFRELILCNQDEELYKRTKRYEMIDVLQKAGTIITNQDKEGGKKDE